MDIGGLVFSRRSLEHAMNAAGKQLHPAIFFLLPTTGLTTNLLTPQICEELNIVPQDRGVRGMAGDGNVQVKTVGLRGVYIDGKIEVMPLWPLLFEFESNILIEGPRVQLSF